MSIIFGIDPGSKKSGYVIFDGTSILGKGEMENEDIIKQIEKEYHLGNENEFIVAIEQIRGYGLVCGDDTFDTCEWGGHFARYAMTLGCLVRMIPRKEIKKHLCGNTTTNDKYVRQALIDRLGEQGSKKNPGPTFGIAGHTWSALAVCVTCYDKK
jgi:hypothetical protein